MPEIKNVFTSGRMNKDLDERLLPKGEYRDALNIEIATSEDSNVGAAQNTLGNTAISNLRNNTNKFECVGSIKDENSNCIYWLLCGVNEDVIVEYNVESESVTPILVSNKQEVTQALSGNTVNSKSVTLSGSNANIKVGMKVTGGGIHGTHTKVEAISGASLTLSTKQSFTGNPTLTFKHNILNFSNNNIITGINIIDGLLLFTDNNNEPKCINIARCKLGTTSSYTTHTKLKINGINKGDLLEENITVIKKSPLNAPNITMYNIKDTSRGAGNVGNTTFSEGSVQSTFTRVISGERVPKETGYTEGHILEIKFVGTAEPHYRTGDTIICKVEKDGEDLEVHVKLKELHTSTSMSKTFRAYVVQISTNVTMDGNTWDCELKQEEALYELKLPRFGYRWKYVDGQYSCFSPFSEVAFLPDQIDGFKYDPEEAFNASMVNTLRSLLLGGGTTRPFDVKPKDVTEVELLYKESNSNVVYILKTLKSEGDFNLVELSGDGFEVTSEQIHAVVSSEQILRSFDNVPRKAIAQEITGNRLLYGNYLQNYNIPENPVFTMQLNNKSVANPFIPQPSLKSMRTYQVGAVFMDEHGRQTPVLTDDSAVVQLNQTAASEKNEIIVGINGGTVSSPDPIAKPDWASHYKFFIKETSNEYYNLAMDRYYLNDDGNIWISFSSSERNKVETGEYLILKKSHNSSEPVADDRGKKVKYKILDISNEIPEFLKTRKVLQGSVDTSFGTGIATTGFPTKDYTFFNVPGTDISADDSKLKDIAIGKDDLYARIAKGTEGQTDFYKIEEIEKINSDVGAADFAVVGEIPNPDYNEAGDFWKIKLEKRWGDDLDFTLDDVTNVPVTNGNYQLKIYRDESQLDKSEFNGRFFVKIKNDIFVKEHIEKRQETGEVEVVQAQAIYYINHAEAAVDSRPEGKDIFEGAAAISIDDAHAYDFDDQRPLPEENLINDVGTGASKTSKKLTLRLTLGGNGRNSTIHAGKNPSSDLVDDPNVISFWKKLQVPGTKLRWRRDNSGDGTVFEIKNHDIRRCYNYRGGNSMQDFEKKLQSNQAVRLELELDQLLPFDPTPGVDNGGITQSAKFNGASYLAAGYSVLQIIEFANDEETFFSDNPGIFETEPKEAIDLDLYYETHETYPIETLNSITLDQDSNNKRDYLQTLTWHNCFSFGNGVESNRVRDDFNQVFIDKGPKVSSVLAEQYKEDRQKHGIIYSGIFNSISDVNSLNQFIAGEKITKNLNPVYGSIQKLHTRNTDIITLCEDKILKILANKDAVYNADGNIQLTATNNVLGQAIPFVGEFGISKNPESYCSHGFRSYFTDKSRGSVLRLSRDGLTEISSKGMRDYFRTHLATSKKLIGTYDSYNNNYNVTLRDDFPATSVGDETISFTESVDGWTSRKSFVLQNGLSINNTYFTFDQGDLYKHNSNAIRNKFYNNNAVPSELTLIFNDSPSSIKNFKTLNYEGTSPRKYKTIERGFSAGTENTVDPNAEGWYCESIKTAEETGSVKTFIDKEGKWFNNILGTNTTETTLQSGSAAKQFPVQGIGNMSSIDDPNNGQTEYEIKVSLADPTSVLGNADITATEIVISAANSSFAQSIVLNVKPNSAYAIQAVDFSTHGTETSAPFGDCVNEGSVTFTNTTTADAYNVFPFNNEVQVTIPIAFNFAATADQTIVVNIKGTVTKPIYSVNGTYDTSVNFATPVTQNAVAFSAIGEQGSTVVIDLETADNTTNNKTFTRATNYNFNDSPPECDLENTEDKSRYDIVTTDTGAGTTASPLTVRAFQLSYTFPNKNVTDEIIKFTARATSALAAASNTITEYQLNESDVPVTGETRTLKIYGAKNSQVTIECTKANGSNILTTTGPKTVSIPNTGSAYSEDIVFPTAASGETYTLKIKEAVSGTSGATTNSTFDTTGSLDGATGTPKVKTVTIQQRENITVSLTATKSLSCLSIASPVTFTSIGDYNTEPDTTPRVVLTYTVTSNAGLIHSNDASDPYAFDNNKWSGTVAGAINTLSNTSEVGWEDLSADINNAKTSVTITGIAKIFKFGTANDVVNLNVDNLINVAPSNIILSSASIAENNSINDVVGNLSTTHCDNASHTYTIGGTDASSFNINSNQLRASSAFDYETKNSYSITIISTDGNSLSFTKAFTITVTDVTESVLCHEVHVCVGGSVSSSTIQYVSTAQYCNGATLTSVPSGSSTFFSTGATNNKIIKFSTVSAGCSSSAAGQGQLKTTTSTRVPTVYAHGLCYYDNCALSGEDCP